MTVSIINTTGTIYYIGGGYYIMCPWTVMAMLRMDCDKRNCCKQEQWHCSHDFLGVARVWMEKSCRLWEYLLPSGPGRTGVCLATVLLSRFKIDHVHIIALNGYCCSA